MSDDDVRAIATDYENDLEGAAARRDTRIRDAIASGRKQVDIAKLTGYSREAIRQTDPKVRAAVQKAARERREARKAAQDYPADRRGTAE